MKTGILNSVGLSTSGGDLKWQGEGTKVEATKTSKGKTPIRYKIPLGDVIFLVPSYFLLYLSIKSDENKLF